MQLCVQILSGGANSVDPDQTAPSGSGSALFAYAIILSETLVNKILGHLRSNNAALYETLTQNTSIIGSNFY